MVAAILLAVAPGPGRRDAHALLVAGEQFTQAGAAGVSIPPPVDSRPYPLDELL